MKYIIFSREMSGLKQEIPILFPNHLVHLDVAKALVKIVGTSRVVAAGEFSPFDLDPDSFHGRSSTIGIKSRGYDDGEFVRMIDYNSGMVS